MLIKKLNEIKDKTLFLEKDENDREINIYHLKDVQFTGENLYYPNILVLSDTLYNPINEKIMSLQTIKSNKQFTIKQTKIIDDTPVFFFIYNTDNYYHFIYDTTPYLIAYFHLKKEITNLKLLMNYPNSQKKEFYKFVTEFLDIVNIKLDDIIIIDEKILYSDVYISTSFTHDDKSEKPPRKEIYDFYKNIVNSINIIKDTPKKIYISRRSWIHGDYSNIGTNYTTRRKLENEDELVELLNNKGFVEVFTEKLSMIEKISYFNNAESVVGAIGGGICNVLFSDKNTKLIALISPTFLEVNKRFIYSLNKVELELFNDTKHIEKEEFKTNMRVKSGEIVGEIEKVNKNSVIISYTNENVAGWNNEIVYDKIEIEKDKLIKLDEGLNSPWLVDLNKINILNWIEK